MLRFSSRDANSAASICPSFVNITSDDGDGSAASRSLFPDSDSSAPLGRTSEGSLASKDSLHSTHSTGLLSVPTGSNFGSASGSASGEDDAVSAKSSSSIAGTSSLTFLTPSSALGDGEARELVDRSLANLSLSSSKANQLEFVKRDPLSGSSPNRKEDITTSADSSSK